MSANSSAKPLSLLDLFNQKWQAATDWIWGEITTPATAWQKFTKAALRVLLIVFREMQTDRITLRASALTFTVILSLVPMLALGTAVLKGLGAGDQMRQAAYRFIDQMEETSNGFALDSFYSDTQENLTATVPAPGTVRPVDAESSVAPVQDKNITSHLRRAVDQIFDYVDRTDFAALGTFGIVGLVLATLSVLGSIEKSMNIIWQAGTGRPMGRKIIDYMSLMILLPVAVNLGLATEATLQSPTLFSYLEAFLPVAWLAKLLLKMLPILTLVITFTLLYRFLPNVRVEVIPALTGGFIGGISWVLVQIIYVKLQIGVARYNAIYGSFASLPLLLLWIYMAWIVFLAGAEMAFSMQYWRNYSWKETVLTPVNKLALAFSIMETVLSDYQDRRVTSQSSLVLRLKRSGNIINGILVDLIKTGKLRPVTEPFEGYVPAAPGEKLLAGEFVDLFFGINSPEMGDCSLAAEALQAARQAVSEKHIHCKP